MKKYYYRFIYNEEGYITGYYTVLEDQSYDCVCEENQHFPFDLTGGWYKFVPSENGKGSFVEDADRKALLQKEGE